MASLLIWDDRTGPIMACKIPPVGSAPRPTVQNSFPHQPSLWPHLQSAWIPQSLTTREARLTLRIIDGVPVAKPRLSVGWEPVPGSQEGTLTVAATGLQPGESLDDLQVVLESTGMEPAEFAADPGATVIELPAPGRYRLRVTDDRVQPVTPVEVVIQ